MHLLEGLSPDHAVISDFAMGLVDVTDDGSPALGFMLVIKNNGKMLYLDPIDPQCFKKTTAIRLIAVLISMNCSRITPTWLPTLRVASVRYLIAI